MKFSEMTDQELIDLAKGLHESIYVVECFGVKDLLNYERATGELEKRGYAFSTRLDVVKIEKEEEDDDYGEVHERAG